MAFNAFMVEETVTKITWSDGTYVAVGENGVDKITVTMEYGRFNETPWFAVWKGGEIVEKYNGALLKGVAF